MATEQRMLGIAYCQKHHALLSKRVEQFVDDLVGREPADTWSDIAGEAMRPKGQLLLLGKRTLAHHRIGHGL
jgi:hypothetical protein